MNTLMNPRRLKQRMGRARAKFEYELTMLRVRCEYMNQNVFRFKVETNERLMQMWAVRDEVAAARANTRYDKDCAAARSLEAESVRLTTSIRHEAARLQNPESVYKFGAHFTTSTLVADVIAGKYDGVDNVQGIITDGAGSVIETTMDSDDPRIEFFSTYMHCTGGGIECIGDWPAFDQAQAQADETQKAIDSIKPRKVTA
jgi:hypothetical protein